ncbi:hypothetical protein C8J55DRAFT_523050 [Lentinula edodes]|uniref:Uncharacterized protein n=1 Tax=Lentinula lateritia TaxID=40482 RepID=A0A9W9A054_9AGAR|nr:hypothetical protein C8J55DRAFT_523050 [Lentinula edodes]
MICTNMMDLDVIAIMVMGTASTVMGMIPCPQHLLSTFPPIQLVLLFLLRQIRLHLPLDLLLLLPMHRLRTPVLPPVPTRRLKTLHLLTQNLPSLHHLPRNPKLLLLLMLLPRVAKFLAQKSNVLRVPKTVTRRRRKTTAMAPRRGRRRTIPGQEHGQGKHQGNHAGGRKPNHGGERHRRTLPGQEHRLGGHEEEHVPIHAGGRNPNHRDERHRRTLPGQEQQHGQGEGEVDHAHGGPGDEGENNAMEDGKKHGDKKGAPGGRKQRNRGGRKDKQHGGPGGEKATGRFEDKEPGKEAPGAEDGKPEREGRKSQPQMGRRFPQTSVSYGADLD